MHHDQEPGRKQAARQRVALTGERYVVAQRAVATSAPHSSGWMHELTHGVPGIPAHAEGGLQARVPANRNTGHPVRRNPSRTEPRVLVAWQNWIAKRLGAAAR